MKRKTDEPEDQPSVKRRRVNSSPSDKNDIISISSKEDGINNSSSTDDSSNILSDDDSSIPSSNDDNNPISSSDDEDSSSVSSNDDNEKVAGKIKRIFIKNFMCFDVMEVNFNPRINFIVGEISSISAILTALTIGLGARASEIGRGPSIKEFIKKGQNHVLIEITITNNGSSAYKYETYGNSITIVRSIAGNTYSYAIKNWKGTVISRKKGELDNIVKGLNIKVDNPILLASGTRLFNLFSRSKETFRLFKTTTRLEVGDFCSTTKELCLVEAKKLLSEYENEIENLEKEIKIAESLNKMNEDYCNLENELLWSKVIQEENQLLQIDAKIKKKEKYINLFQNNINDNAAKEKEIGAKIKNLREEVKAKISDCNSKVSELKNKYFTLLQDAIKKVQVKNSAESRKHEAMKKKAICEQALDNVQATLSAKQTELKQLEENNRKIENTEGHEYQLKIDFHKKNIELCNLRQQLATFEKESNDTEALYGSSMHELLRRIKEAHNKRKFKEKPIGPLGSFIRSKDSSWIPAIENHFGVDTLTSFCVDNTQDSSVLDTIMEEVYHDNRRPKIRISKFFPHVHDVRKIRTNSSIYLNLLDVLEISHPVIANSLIDEREIQCTLLIPTSEEAHLIMSDIKKVPRNCKRAITKQADLFYPTPVYHDYKGMTTKPKFLQVSTNEAIKALQKEIEIKKEELQQLNKKMTNIDENKKKNKEKMEIVQQTVRRSNQNKNLLQISIDEAKQIIESSENVASDTVLTELKEVQSLIAQMKEVETNLMEKLHKLQKRLQSKSIEDKIEKLYDEKQRLNFARHGVKKRIREEKQILQKLSATHQHQQSVVKSKIENANKACSRINTRRTSEEINAKLKELKVTISVAEYILKDAAKEELNEKKTSYKVIKDLTAVLMSPIQDFEECKIKYLEAREQLIIHRIQQTFKNLLSLRNYKGKITIDHDKYQFNLEVTSKKDAKCLTNDNETICNDQDFYSTVALILAFWDAVELPFYFLDTTVFMFNNKNGRIIMDLLLKHAQSNSQDQFVFLTPVDIPHIQADNSITIHRLPTSPKETA